MSRKPNTFGGGARTNVNGLSFEQTTSLDDALKDAGYRVEEYEVYNKNDKIGLSVGKINFYNFFLKENGIDYCVRMIVLLISKIEQFTLLKKNFNIVPAQWMKNCLIVILRKKNMRNYATQLILK